MMRQWCMPEVDTYFRPMLDQDPRGFQIGHLELAMAHCNSFRTAVDGGAHIGTWTVYMAERFRSVLSFEPARDAFECLQANTARLANVRRHNLALGATHGSAMIADDPTRMGNTGARYLRMNGKGNTEVVPLDDFGLQELDFLKLDVEGYEFHALTGALATIQACRPVIVIEVKQFTPPRFGVDHHAAVRLLIDLGYREAAAARNDRVFVHA